MENLKLELAKEWQTNEHSETPDKIILELAEKDVTALKKHLKYAKENRVNILYSCCADHYDNDGEDSDFPAEDEVIKIYWTGSLYYKAQSKYDSSDQFTSEEIVDANLLKLLIT